MNQMYKLLQDNLIKKTEAQAILDYLQIRIIREAEKMALKDWSTTVIKSKNNTCYTYYGVYCYPYDIAETTIDKEPTLNVEFYFFSLYDELNKYGKEKHQILLKELRDNGRLYNNYKINKEPIVLKFSFDISVESILNDTVMLNFPITLEEIEEK